MSVSAVTNSTAANSQDVAAAATSATSQMMSEQDFLNLLVTQMTSQDPLDPMTNQDLLTQMVQFSTLQQNTSMQSAMTTLQSSQLTAQANDLMGRQVLVQTGSSTTTQGVVSGVDLSSGTPQIVVNGASYPLSQVLAISNAPSNSTPTSTP